ncbi:MAG: thioredoxin [Bacteroidales bacterium]|jgi:thioredoxin 1|nr:thioredoxin [Bacteroidales bacterium]MDY0086338.1 thioredoxin [Bacteroidales bacterium]
MKGNFNSLINGDLPVLVDFHAEWCQPCKVQAPIIKEVAAGLKDRIRVIKIDVDANRLVSTRYHISAVPTLALFKKGELVWRESGLLSKAQLISAIERFV